MSTYERKAYVLDCTLYSPTRPSMYPTHWAVSTALRTSSTSPYSTPRLSREDPLRIPTVQPGDARCHQVGTVRYCDRSNDHAPRPQNQAFRLSDACVRFTCSQSRRRLTGLPCRALEHVPEGEFDGYSWLRLLCSSTPFAHENQLQSHGPTHSVTTPGLIATRTTLTCQESLAHRYLKPMP